uniref:Zinc finger and SCAN domain containing 5B n=1 Tax=Saimiri boliviensis boliviensis TaxID=39432 RepID=A0A2K6TBI2_SAIBB
MAANCRLPWRQGEPQNSPGLQLPQSVASPGTQLRNDYGDPETWHMNFRMFSCPEQSDPIQALRKLTELCHLWLRPDLHTKEQILDMLVMEQFMISMPQELQEGTEMFVLPPGGDFLLPETTDIKGNPKSPGPKQTLEKNLKENSEEKPGLTSPEPQLPKGHDLERAKDGKEPQKRASVENVDADTASACAVETEASTHSEDRDSPNPRGPKRSKPDATSISQEEPQGGATPVGNRDSPGPAGMNPVHSPGLESTGSHPDGQEAVALPPFVCAVCSKEFKYFSQLKLHNRSHTGERPFECHECGKRFLQASDLRVHQRIHTGEKPYTCDVCNKQFAHESTLQGHRRMHTGEKPFKCKFCSKVFSHKGNLNVHLRTHSGEKPYKCPMCGNVFRQLGTFKRHLKTHQK